MASDVTTQIILITVEAILTGVQFTTFLLCLRWQIYSDDGRSTRKNIQWFMLIVTLFIMAFSIADLIGTIQIKTTVLNGGKLPTSVICYTNTAKGALVIAIDSVLVYRCWVVYNKSWLMTAFPFLLLLFIFLCSIIIAYSTMVTNGPELHTTPLTQVVPNRRIVHMDEAFLFATIVINTYATSAIIIKICRSAMPERRMDSAFIFAIRVIAESGSIYTLTNIIMVSSVFIGTYLGHPFPLLVTNAIFSPIGGIAYNLIFIRVAVNRAECQTDIVFRSIVVKDDMADKLKVAQGGRREDEESTQSTST